MHLDYFLANVGISTRRQTAGIIYESLTHASDNALDSLINQLLSLKPLTGPAASKLAGPILEAVVLSSSPLLQSKDKGDGQYRVIIKGNNNQQYELNSKFPLAEGSRVQLKLSGEQNAILLKVLGQTDKASATASSNSTNPIANKPVAPLQQQTPPRSQQPPATDKITEGIRQNLPLQQPLKALPPLLQQLSQTNSQAIPKQLTELLTTLLQQFSTPEQLQQATALKQAIRNSGTFLESKLAFSQQSKNAEALLNSPALQNDVKTLIQKLAQAINKQDSNPQTSGDTRAAQAPDKPTAPGKLLTELLAVNKTSDKPSASSAQEQSAIAATIPTATAQVSVPTTSQSSHQELSSGVLLQQLGRQLLASLARTQVNQLESLAQRANQNPDNQGSSNSWVIELPVINGQRIDNLELRIDQEANGEEQQTSSQQQWTVMLNFDLHALGRMSIELTIIDKSVSAKIWSQQQTTHLQVEQEIKHLQQGLEKAGVKVDKLNCLHGLPNNNGPQLQRQLVDLHT